MPVIVQSRAGAHLLVSEHPAHQLCSRDPLMVGILQCRRLLHPLPKVSVCFANFHVAHQQILTIMLYCNHRSCAVPAHNHISCSVLCATLNSSPNSFTEFWLGALQSLKNSKIPKKIG